MKATLLWMAHYGHSKLVNFNFPDPIAGKLGILTKSGNSIFRKCKMVFSEIFVEFRNDDLVKIRHCDFLHTIFRLE